jgi:hypothetical protein
VVRIANRRWSLTRAPDSASEFFESRAPEMVARLSRSMAVGAAANKSVQESNLMIRVVFFGAGLAYSPRQRLRGNVSIKRDRRKRGRLWHNPM